MSYTQALKDRLAESLDPEMQERYKARRKSAMEQQEANYQGPEAMAALSDGQRTRALYSGLARAANQFGSVGGDGGPKTTVPETMADFDKAAVGDFTRRQDAYQSGVKAEDAAIEGIQGLDDRGVKYAGALDAAQRTGLEREREDASYAKGQAAAALEDDASSDVSKSYQALASRMTGGKDYSNVPASRLKAVMPSLERLYTVEEQTQAKRAAAESQRQAMAAAAAERAAAREEAKALREAEYARSRADKQADREAEAKLAASKPKQLGAEERKRLDNARMAQQAVDDMDKALANDVNTFSLIGDNDYTEARRRFQEAFGRLQSGGAIGKDEEARFAAMAPSATDSKEMQRKKLGNMKRELEAIASGVGQNAGGASGAPAFPRIVTNDKGETATVSDEAELKEAQVEGFK